MSHPSHTGHPSRNNPQPHRGPTPGPSSGNYAGRGGRKLEYALRHWGISVPDSCCADLGSHVGGFVDCLLQHGARKVYSVDTGYGTLAWKLRQDPRVVVMERTNALHCELPEKVDMVTIDTGWTRQVHILPKAMTLIHVHGIILSLLKPHYEARREQLRKGILGEHQRHHVIRKVRAELRRCGIDIQDMIPCPIVGQGRTNQEFWMRIQKA